MNVSDLLRLLGLISNIFMGNIKDILINVGVANLDDRLPLSILKYKY